MRFFVIFVSLRAFVVTFFALIAMGIRFAKETLNSMPAFLMR